MTRPDVVDLALVAGCLGLAVWSTVAGGETLLTGVFIAFVYSCLAVLGRAGAAGALRVRREATRARELARTDPRELARAAISEERQRLAVDIGETLRRTMVTISAQARALDAADPLPGLKRIHAQSQLATSELRRHLGLLRGPVDPPPPAPEERRPVGRPAAGDVWFAVGLALLAAVEATVYSRIEGRPYLPWSPVWTALAAATVVGRRRAPAAACAACALVYVAATWHGFPVTGGFWVFGGVGALLWAVSARGRWSVEFPAGGLLVAAVAWTRSVDDPVNLPATLVIMGVAVAAGLVSRLLRRREQASRRRVAAREAELAETTRAAVTAERSGFARDLHDVASHAVGVIAVQAAAGQVSWPHDPEAVARAAEVIGATAGAALADLDRLGLEGRSPARGTGDLPELVARIRATGTPVDLTILVEPPPDLATVVHRVVQEALTNAVRHAPGAAVSVRVERRDDQLVVTVQDEGRGPAGPSTRGYGLIGLGERVALAGGALRSGGAGTRGFVVEAVLPLDREAVTG